jgi:uncharacterized phiE125 gp8 family phage protein
MDVTKLVASQPAMKVMAAQVIEAPEPISLEQAKEHLRVVYDDEDSYISGLIVAAREMAEGKLNRTIKQRVREAAFCNWSNIVLRKPPFVSVESLSYIDSTGEEQYLEDYAVRARSEPARIALPYGFSAPSLQPNEEAIVVRYVAGYPEGEVPQPIFQWMLLVIGTMYENRETMSAGVNVTSIPEDFFKWLLQPYMVYE